MWFTNLGSDAIGRMSPSGQSTTLYYTQSNRYMISYPLSISRGPDGAMWFTNQNGNSIGRITT